MEDHAGTRIISFNVEPPAYEIVSEWAARQGHHLGLVVTTPGPPPRTYYGYRDIVALAPPRQDILVSTDMKRIAPAIAAFAPDLIVSFTFPYRLPPAITEIPRYGAVNLHPTPLPSYRGPNPARMVYNGETTLGATLHRMDVGFDTGPILSRHETPMPADPTLQNILATWREISVTALDEGARRALAGDWGEPQDDASASYAAAFTEEETWLDWERSTHTLQRRATALNLVVPRAKAMIDGASYDIREVRPLPDAPTYCPPGKVLDRSGDVFIICAADGAVQVTATPR